MKKYIYMSALALGLCLSSCDSYLDINQDPTSPSESNVTSSMIMPGVEMAISSAYGDYLRIVGGYYSEVYAHLNGTSNYVDYSQFSQSATRSSSTYARFYDVALVNLKTILEKSEAAEEWGSYLAATTLRAFCFEALVDCYGETPYTEALDADNLAPKYDDGKTVYEGVIAEIDNALAKASASNTVCTNFLYPGENADNWIKFAKALKLRMLMRMADVDNSVLTEAGALISENDFPTADVAFANCWSNEAGSMNPFYSEEFSSAWGSTQTNIAANLAIIGTMQVTNASGDVVYTDPRISAFFDKNGSGKYIGGISGTNYPSTSTLTSWCRPVMAYNTPVVLLPQFETEFFIAEYYARTGNEAQATAHYNEAIELSFAEAGVEGAAEHIARYPFDKSNYKKSIGIQKWVALSGIDTFEAWCEVRRLNYPAFDTSVKGTTFYKLGDDSSFTNLGYTEGTLYTPITVFGQVGDNKLLERFPYAEYSSARNSNVPSFPGYTSPVFWGAN